MLHTFSLGKAYLGSGWAIHPLSGALLKTSVESVERFCNDRLPPIVNSGLKQCDNPYLLTPPSNSLSDEKSGWSEDKPASQRIHDQFKKMKGWRSLNFYAAILYASIPSICFQNSRDAFVALNSQSEQLTRDTCLEKCLTIAKCSASFRNNGVLFIGAHLPLQAMHAWIIEDGYQPDDDDRQWVNFLPLMAITHNNRFA